MTHVDIFALYFFAGVFSCVGFNCAVRLGNIHRDLKRIADALDTTMRPTLIPAGSYKIPDSWKWGEAQTKQPPPPRT